MNYSICSIINKGALLLLLLVYSAHASPALAADFGVADWAMTRAAVKDLETRPNLTPFGEQNYLIYSVDLGNIQNTRLVYQFTNDQLTEGRFLFWPDNRSDAATAIAQYNQIKALLSRQYGAPLQDLVITEEPATMLSPSQYARELSADRLILKSQWQAPNALLYHQLAWHNGKPHHQIHYLPKEPKLMMESTM